MSDPAASEEYEEREVACIKCGAMFCMFGPIECFCECVCNTCNATPEELQAENAALRQQLSHEIERLNEIIACYSRESVRLRKRLRISEAVLNQITCINPLQLSPLGYELLTAYLVLRDATEEPEKLP